MQPHTLSQFDERSSDELEDGGRSRLGRRRGRRLHKRGALAIAGMLIAAVLAGAPTLISFSRLPARTIEDWFAARGWTAEVGAVQLGWFAPLRVGPLQLKGPSHQTELSIEKLETELTLLALLWMPDDLGELTVQQLDAELVIYPGGSSLERDLEPFFEDADEPAEGEATTPRFIAQVDQASVQFVDGVTRRRWICTELTSVVSSRGADAAAPYEILFQGNVLGLQAVPGKLQAEVELRQGSAWRVKTSLQQLSLDLLSLAARRFDWSDSLLADCQGVADGTVSIESDESLRAGFAPLAISGLRLTGQKSGSEPTVPDLLRLSRLEVSGKATYAAGVLAGDPLTFRSDVGGGQIVGTVATEVASATDLAAWLRSWAGHAELQLDLPALTMAAPRMLRLKPDARIHSGSVNLNIQRAGDIQDSPLSVQLDTAVVEAESSLGPLRLQPLHAQFALRPAGEWIALDAARLESVFANLEGTGDPRSGDVKFRIDLQKLGELLAPISEWDANALQGQAEGTLVWTVTPDQRWQADAEIEAQQLRIAPAGEVWLNEPALEVLGTARGVWQSDRLQRLEAAQARLKQADQNWQLELVHSVESPAWTGPFPIVATGTGELAALHRFARAWIPEEIAQLAGRYTISAQFYVGSNTGVLESAQVELLDASGYTWNRSWAQPHVRAQFRGSLPWPADEMRLDQLTLQSSVLSVSGKGQGSLASDGQLELAVRADLAELQKLLELTGSSSATVPPASDVVAQGQVTGTIGLQRRAAQVQAQWSLEGQQVRLLRTGVPVASASAAGPIRPASNATRSPELIWEEPRVQLSGNLTSDLGTGAWKVDGLQLNTPWGETQLTGSGAMAADGTTGKLNGTSRIQFASLASRLGRWLGMAMNLGGDEPLPLSLSIDTTARSAYRWVLESTLAWQQAEIAGFPLGSARLPLRVTDQTIALARTSLAVQGGTCQLAGEMHYQDDPQWIQLEPGLRADDLQMSEVMARSWLKFIAPIAADATGISGRVSVELDEGVVWLGQPERSRLVGRLHVAEARLGPGPLAQQLLGLAKQIEDLVDGKIPAPGQPLAAAAPWVELPPQTIDFRLEQGTVVHDRMMFKAGNVVFYTGGRVGLDGRLAVTAQVPLPSEWVEKQSLLQPLAGTPLVLPITGTLSRPTVDSQQLTNAWARLGTQAIQGAAQNLLERELQRGIGRWLGTPAPR